MGGPIAASIKGAADLAGIGMQAGFNKAAASTAWKRSKAGATTSYRRKRAVNKRERRFNRRQATTAYQRKLKYSNTKYQRQMADLRKAGLNPMLAYSQAPPGPGSIGQASASGGSVPQASAHQASAIQTSHLGSMVDQYYQAQVMRSQVLLNNAKAYSATQEGLGRSHTNTYKKQVGDLIRKGRKWFDRSHIEEKSDAAMDWVLTDQANAKEFQPKFQRRPPRPRKKTHSRSGSSMKKNKPWRGKYP